MRGWPCVVVAALLSAGCAGSGARPRPAAGALEDTTDSGAFDRALQEILRQLAAIDRRIARRARITPTEEDLRRVALAAVFQEDANIAVIDGAIDPFSFDARMRGLESIRAKVAAMKTGPARRGEHELLVRLIDSELARLEEERSLPRSASALIRGVVETWSNPKDTRDAEEQDRWLARRVGEIGTSMGKPLDIVRARELDDTLDALERLTSNPGYPKTTKELVKLREKLEAVDSRPPAKSSDWAVIGNRVRSHLGIQTPPEELARAFEVLETELRPRAEAAAAQVKASGGLPDAALDLGVLAKEPCFADVQGSLIRSMAPPPEREPACRLIRAIAVSESRAWEYAVLHTHVVVAAWALDVARGAATLAEASSKHRLLPDIPPEIRAHFERLAVGRPAAAIGAGEAVRILVVDPIARAKAWRLRGDAPFDIVRRDLP